MSKFYTPEQLSYKTGLDIEHIYFLMHNDILRTRDDIFITAESVNQYFKDENYNI